MQQTSPVACPECGQVVGNGQLNVHLRQTHHLYVFRGLRAPLPNTLASVLNALCQDPPDPLAYQLLEHIAREKHGRKAADFVASLLALALGRVELNQVPTLADALAQVVAARPSARAVTLLLAANPLPAARHLALTLTTRLPAPVDRRFLRAVRPLLSDRALPPEVQFTTAAALLRHTVNDSHSTAKLLRAVVKGRSKLKAIVRLRQLELHVGPVPGLEGLLHQLEERVRSALPALPGRIGAPHHGRPLVERTPPDPRRTAGPRTLADD